MYVLKPGVKKNPLRRWRLPDRIFFGYGACHILAGVYLQRFPDSGFEAFWIKPHHGLPGNHIFVANGAVAFDFHGYADTARLIAHHGKGWTGLHPQWSADIQPVDFPLLDTASLNARKMLGPDQYLLDAIPRASKFIDRFAHPCRILEAVAGSSA